MCAQTILPCSTYKCSDACIIISWGKLKISKNISFTCERWRRLRRRQWRRKISKHPFPFCAGTVSIEYILHFLSLIFFAVCVDIIIVFVVVVAAIFSLVWLSICTNFLLRHTFLFFIFTFLLLYVPFHSCS